MHCRPVFVPLLVVCLCASCAATSGTKPPVAAPAVLVPADPPDPAPRSGAPAVLIRDATVLTAAGATFSPGYVLMQDGKIAAVGGGEPTAGAGVTVIDGSGKFVTPGIIDAHSHVGVFPMPYVDSLHDGNEATSPVTADLWAEHSFWPQDPAIPRLVAGGVTTVQVLPGSANLIGGRSFVAKLLPAVSARAMRFPGAPQGLKMACGENPKMTYGREKSSAPSTRMANLAGYRKAFQAALEYKRALEKYGRELGRYNAEKSAGDTEGDPPEPPGRDLGHETLVKVLNGEMAVHFHCYRADEMEALLDLAKEYGFKIRAFHHALEAYKLADRLAAEDVGVATWSDWWGFKLEAFDGIPHNAALVAAAGGRTIIHSDYPEESRHLNQEAAKALASGKALGLALTEDDALRWITTNPAWALGIEDRVGALTPGQMADVVLWNRHPFSVYALAEKVYIDGILAFDRTRPEGMRPTDFELGQPAREDRE
ncbi:MAG: amidohydrolase [Deltaproteobacteria bacterium]|nr:amidohydrolase [Deltaproteobacteria bacterium]